VQIDGQHLILHELRAEGARLIAHGLEQLGATHLTGHAGIVGDLVGQAQRAGRQPFVDHQGAVLAPCGVDCGRGPGRAAADDDHVIVPAPIASALATRR